MNSELSNYLTDSTDAAQADGVVPGLYALPPAPLPFDESLEIRSFLLQRPAGNLLVYNSGTTAGVTEAMAEHGAVSRRYLNHWHEALLGCDAVQAPVLCHAADRAQASERCDVHDTFSARHTLDGDFEVIPTPGHTPGATAYLWDTGQHRCLFTGDTLYLRDGEWVAAVLASSERSSYMESLELIRDLDFDVLVPWAATAGRPYRAITGKADAVRRIDEILERLWQGADH